MEQSAGCDSKPSKAEDLFQLFKKAAAGNKTLSMKEFWSNAANTFSAGKTFNNLLKQMEEAGVLRRVFTSTGMRGRPPLTHITLLRDEFSLPQGRPEINSAPLPADLAEKPKSAVARAEENLTVPAAPKPPQLVSVSAVVSKSSAPVSVKTESASVVFIDENQIIASERDGHKLDLNAILEKIRRSVGGIVERIYFYYSMATEKRNRQVFENLLHLNHRLVRMIKTGSQPGVVDRRIREDVDLWLRSGLVSTVVIGTADGGPDFVAAIEQIKQAGKKFALLKLGDNFNSVLRQTADILIDASNVGARRKPFEEIVLAAHDGNISHEDKNTRFLFVLTAMIADLFEYGNKGRVFFEIFKCARSVVRGHREFDGFTDEDIRGGLTVLIQVGGLLSWKKESSGQNVYYLSHSNPLLRIMPEHPVPVLKR